MTEGRIDSRMVGPKEKEEVCCEEVEIKVIII